jgi:hypothetical protein
LKTLWQRRLPPLLAITSRRLAVAVAGAAGRVGAREAEVALIANLTTQTRRTTRTAGSLLDR